MRLIGTVSRGMGLAGCNLEPVRGLIEDRSGLRPLIPNTLNLKLSEAYHFTPDFTVTKAFLVPIVPLLVAFVFIVMSRVLEVL